MNNLSSIIENVTQYNQTGKGVPTIPRIQVLDYTLTCIVLILNIAVVISSGLILRLGGRIVNKKATYLFLGNLALTEIFNTSSSMIRRAFVLDAITHPLLCIIIESARIIPYVTHLYSIGLIAFDRYLFISYGIQYEQLLYAKRARILIIFTWILGIFVGSLIPMGWKRSNFKSCVMTGIAPKEFILFLFVITAIPAFGILIFYSIILFYALRKINHLDGVNNQDTGSNLRAFRGKTDTSASKSNTSVDKSNDDLSGSKWTILKNANMEALRKKLKAIYIVLLLIGCFIFSWLPFLTWLIVYSYTCVDEIGATIKSVRCDNMRYYFVIPFAHIHGVFNPLVYAWWHNGFRNFCKKHFGALFKCKK